LCGQTVAFRRVAVPLMSLRLRHPAQSFMFRFPYVQQNSHHRGAWRRHRSRNHDILEASGAALDIETIEIGEKVYLRGNIAGIDPSAWESLRRTKVFLKAPITTPQGGGFKSLSRANITSALQIPFPRIGRCGTARRPRCSRCMGSVLALPHTIQP
jgi:hypothetical protein